MSQNGTKKIFLLLFFLLIAGFLGCSENSSGEPVVLPRYISPFALYPNDLARNDSASAYVVEGVQLPVHPKASYKLSFDKDANIKDAPTLELFRLGETLDDGKVLTRHVRTLEPREENGRYVYEFLCEEQERNVWLTTLVLDGELYKGSTKHARLEAEGAFSDTLSLNLIVSGKIDFYEPDMDIDTFAKRMLEKFRQYYTSITIDTLYVRYAHEHPTVGANYPPNEPWIAGRSSSDYFLVELGGWPERRVNDALDIILVHRIELDGVLGYSLIYGGSLQGGVGSTVVIGAYNKTASGEEGLTASSMIVTAVHETGHFLGLRHTTTTIADFDVEMDYSNYEDGFDDTPFCRDLLHSGLLKKKSEESRSDYAVWPRFKGRFAATEIPFDITNCPDYRNMMFPAINEEGVEGFSQQQLQNIRKNLMVYPH